jgi:hypothetical protein
VKLYFPKYIDKVVIIEIKQTCHTVWLHWENISICFYLFLKHFRVQTLLRLEKWSAEDGVS